MIYVSVCGKIIHVNVVRFEDMMNRYKKLLSDTAVYGMGTFASKLLVFFLTRLYTECLTSAEYGQADLVANVANLLIPLAAAGICDGIFRFTLDRERDKRAVFSTGMFILCCSGAMFLLLSPLLWSFEYFRDYAWLIVAYVLFSNFHSSAAQYIRALDKTKLFAVQGIINTVLTISFNILFLVILPDDSFFNGVHGYVLSIVIADFLVGVFLFVYARLWKDISRRYVDRSLATSMLKYSLPLIPTTIFWWITNVSDRYMLTFLLVDDGEAVTGLYTAAYKIPTLLTLVTGVFSEAWQFSAVREDDPNERAGFYSTVFESFQAIIFLGAVVVVTLSRFFAGILFADAYYTAWEFIPILVISSVFSSFVNFLSSVYVVKKRSMKSFVTSMIGALTNISLNFVLIPSVLEIGGKAVFSGAGLGAQGAAIATVTSYLIVFFIRAFDARRMLKFDMHPVKLAVNVAVLLFGVVSMLCFSENIALLVVTQLISVALIALINARPMIKSANAIFKSIKSKKD